MNTNIYFSVTGTQSTYKANLYFFSNYKYIKSNLTKKSQYERMI